MLMHSSNDKSFLNENTSSASSIFGSMNGSLYASPALGEPIINPNHNSISPIKSSPLLDVDITAISPTSNGGQYHQSQLTQHQGPLHIPAKRLGLAVNSDTGSGHRSGLSNSGNTSAWSSYSPTSDNTSGAVNGTSTNGTSFLQDSTTNYNNNNTTSPASPSRNGIRNRGEESSPIDHSLTSNIASAAASAAAELTSQASAAMAATASYPTSHYSASLAASEASRRAAAAAAAQQQTDSKLSSFWQNDYYKSATVASGLPPTVTETCQPSAASFSHSAAAWNYPHPGGYAAAAALATPEQAAEARRHMAAADHFNHAADYTRLQYAPDGIYSHPPGKLLMTFSINFRRIFLHYS